MPGIRCSARSVVRENLFVSTAFGNIELNML